MRKHFSSVDEYIDSFPDDTKIVLKNIRKTIKKLLPDAEQTISYQIPTFKLNGKYVIYFAGFKKHVSLYPIPSGSESFLKKLSPFIKGKGTMQFPLDKPIPYDLIEEITKFSLEANLKRTKKSKY